MIETLVRYLRSQNVPFRLCSYPSPEPLPTVAFRIPQGGQLVSTRVLLVEGVPTIAVLPEETTVEFSALASELDTLVVEGSMADLPPPFDKSSEPLPPFGGAMGVPTIVDQEASRARILVFRAFSPNDIVEVSYDDFERIERPRVASFAVMGELEARAQVGT